jgi:hypothetical protein
VDNLRPEARGPPQERGLGRSPHLPPSNAAFGANNTIIAIFLADHNFPLLITLLIQHCQQNVLHSSGYFGERYIQTLMGSYSYFTTKIII